MNLDLVKTNIDWADFLSRHDMLWKRLPSHWTEGPWTGNGMLGSMVWSEDKALRIQAFRGDVQAHRPMTQGTSGYTRGRLQIGWHDLIPKGEPSACDLRLGLHGAELVGTLTTTQGSVRIRHFTHAEEMTIVTEIESLDGEGPISLTWTPDKNAMPTRKGYAETEADLPRVQKQYNCKYPTEPFLPNPDAIVKSVDGVNVCVQDMLGGSQHCTAWQMIETGTGNQRLVVSIANRWPLKNNDPIADAVAAVKKVSALTGSEYDSWKQQHYDWWHAYYSQAFVSLTETTLETQYWTTMYKLGSATRADRAMMDTAGIWQTPSKWPDSHWDFNIQYCYYPVAMANRVDLGKSLIRTFNTYQDNLIKNVSPVEWQKDSSYLPVTTGHDLYQPRDADDRTFQNTGGHLVWAMHACWLIYRASMDETMLRDTIFPVLSRAVNYQIHRLEKIDGVYHAPVSHSPEYDEAYDCNYELSMLRWGCHALLTAGKRLEIDDAVLARYRDILDNLVDFPADETGLMVGRDMPFDRDHRHWCHLQMIHPLQLLTGKTEAERDLVSRSIENFVQVNIPGGDYAPFQQTGVAAMRLLLGEGDKALEQLLQFMKHPRITANGLAEFNGTNPCLETPIYTAQNLHEMLLQCYDEFPTSGEMTATIRVFPAVPSTWPSAVFHNLRTAGAFLVSGQWLDGQTTWVRVKSLAGEPCRIKPNLSGAVKVTGIRNFTLHDLGDGCYDLDLKQGEEALLYSGDSLPQAIIEPVPAQEQQCNHYGLAE